MFTNFGERICSPLWNVWKTHTDVLQDRLKYWVANRFCLIVLPLPDVLSERSKETLAWNGLKLTCL